MSLNLIIGIATKVSIRKTDAKKVFDSVNDAILYMKETFTPQELYYTKKTREYVHFILKPTLIEKELTKFIECIYIFKYHQKNMAEHGNEIVNKLESLKTADNIMQYAKESKHSDFKWSKEWYSEWIKGTFQDDLYADLSGIIISEDGPIVMECCGSLFDFIQRLIRERFSIFSISRAVYVTYSK